MDLGLFTKRISAVATTPSIPTSQRGIASQIRYKSGRWLDMTLKQLAMLGYTSTNALAPQAETAGL